MHNLEQRRFWKVLIILLIGVMIASYISLVSGAYQASFLDVYHTLFRIEPTHELDLMLLEFRMPRIILAGLVGFGLAVAGTIIQAITRNGLADPGILGINAGAGFAIVLFMFIFLGELAYEGWKAALLMPAFGFIGGLIAALCIFLLTWDKGRLDPQRLILVGIAIGMGFSAVSLYISLKMDASNFDAATIWLTGTIWNANWYFVLVLIPILLILIPILFFKSHTLDLFQLSEESVINLGVRAEKEKIILLLTSIAIIASCVSVSGNIGFIGLISPHIARRLIGLKHQFVLPISGAIGTILVILADLIAKTIVLPAELPVGIIVALIGVPYFVFLLLKEKL